MSSMGRSPFPSRSGGGNNNNTSRGGSSRRLELDDASGAFASPSLFPLGGAAAAAASFARSPSSGAGGGGGLPSSYVSPRHAGHYSKHHLAVQQAAAAAQQQHSSVRGLRSTSGRISTFFDRSPPASSGNTPTVNANTSSTSTNTTTNNSTSGMNVEHIRQLAHACQVGTEPDMRVFYTCIVYSKTNAIEDALLYAQALQDHQEYRRAVHVLEQALLQSTSTMTTTASTMTIQLECTLLMAKSLSMMGEWQPALQLLQDASTLDYETLLMDDDELGWNALVQMYNPPLSTETTAVAPPNDDDDDDGDERDTSMLHVEVEHENMTSNTTTTTTSTTSLHPIARLCVWRAKCYDATSHPPRAKLFWQRALQIDPKCTTALDSLLERHLLLPEESIQFVESLSIPVEMDWLKQVYLARLHVLTTTTNSTSANRKTNESLISNNGHSTASLNLEEEFHVFENEPSSPNQNTSHTTNTPTHNNNTMKSTTTVFKKNQKKSQKQVHAVDMALHKLKTVYQLDQSPEILALAAIRAYRRYDLPSAFMHSQELYRMDPLEPKAALVHVATLLALGYKRLLFALAHEWVRATPQSAISWFAVGSYYYSCGRYHVAQQHYLRATRLDPLCMEAWIAFGCAFALCDESDQALASFRAAQRLGPCESASLLYMGMEYIRTNHLVLAHHSLLAALPGGDPLCCHELGVVAFLKQEYATCIRWYQTACRCIVQLQERQDDEFATAAALAQQDDNDDDMHHDDDDSEKDLEKRKKLENVDITLIVNSYWEPTIFNLGMAYRKTMQFEKAAHCFQHCLVLHQHYSQNNSSNINSNANSNTTTHNHMAITWTALGIVQTFMGKYDDAIESYHSALSIKRDDTLTLEWLQLTLQESLEHSSTSSFFLLHHGTSAAAAAAAAADTTNTTFDHDTPMSNINRRKSRNTNTTPGATATKLSWNQYESSYSSKKPSGKRSYRHHRTTTAMSPSPTAATSRHAAGAAAAGISAFSSLASLSSHEDDTNNADDDDRHIDDDDDDVDMSLLSP